MPEISVVIPAHNAAAHLPETLRSVERQTFTDWEIVAVDDGSHDQTWSILSDTGPRVRVFRNAEALGPAAARNRAISAACGRFVVFLDADDLIAPNYMESQLRRFRDAVSRGVEVGIVTCDARILDEDGYAPHTYLDMLHDAGAPLTLERILGRNSIYISSLVPTAVGASVGWFDEELFGTEDFGLWLKILEQGYEAILNPVPLAVYRRGRGSVSSNIARQGINNRRVYELALGRGRLTARQQTIARRAIRYNVAMEAVAQLRFGTGRARSAARLVRLLPLLASVAFSHRELWGQWVGVLRSGRQVPTGGRAPR